MAARETRETTEAESFTYDQEEVHGLSQFDAAALEHWLDEQSLATVNSLLKKAARVRDEHRNRIEQADSLASRVRDHLRFITGDLFNAVQLAHDGQADVDAEPFKIRAEGYGIPGRPLKSEGADVPQYRPGAIQPLPTTDEATAAAHKAAQASARRGPILGA